MSSNEMNFTNQYLNWLRDNITEETIGQDLYEITLPFLDFRNDYIQIYIKKLGDSRYRVTDLGLTINELELSGVHLDTAKRKELFRFNLLRHGLMFDTIDDSVYTDVDISEIALAKHRIIQGIMDINDMFYLSTSNVRSLFIEDVRIFFEENNIFYTADINITGQSGLTHSYDFLLQRNKDHNDRLISTMNRPDKANTERLLFRWWDTEEVRNKKSYPMEFYVFMNDDKNVSAEVISAFQQYGATPIQWSKRQEALPLLAS